MFDIVQPPFRSTVPFQNRGWNMDSLQYSGAQTAVEIVISLAKFAPKVFMLHNKVLTPVLGDASCIIHIDYLQKGRMANTMLIY